MADTANANSQQTPRRKKPDSRSKKRVTRADKTIPARKKSKSSQIDLFDDEFISPKEEIIPALPGPTAKIEPATGGSEAEEQSPEPGEAVVPQQSSPPFVSEQIDQPIPERHREPFEDADDASLQPDLSRFSPPTPEMGPKRLLRSQRQRAAKIRKLIYIGGSALLLVLLIGLVMTLLTRTRVRVATNGGPKSTEIAETVPSEGEQADVPSPPELPDNASGTMAESTASPISEATAAPPSSSDSVAEFQSEAPQEISAVPENSPPAATHGEETPPSTSAGTTETTPSIASLNSPAVPADAKQAEQADKELFVSGPQEQSDQAPHVAESAMAESTPPSLPDAGAALPDSTIPAVPSGGAAKTSEKPSAIDFTSPWTNSLGMRFIPVQNVLFSIWETRVKDFEAFCKATARERDRAPFEETGDHPVSRINWNDAQEFCGWLTQKERAEGIIGPGQYYRLPTDLEWSLAVGLDGETGDTPEARDTEIFKTFPWGSAWPPPNGSGNIADRSASSQLNSTLDDYDDGFVRSAPVGSFKANSLGIFDLSGNLWEWCQDAYGGKGKLRNWRVMRGGAWSTYRRKELLSSYRNVVNPDSRGLLYGFRCVLVQE
jgi:formylglycine-generating enzyme required for sulfatase activity